ncbi:hypothetical protein BUALT_Bualt09G0092500 [Buddleja alternifolia]|uniref:Secoisolariciresinol dehydrogenase n=1 Tax=Buddleja alternifolia TaxID=168488 RepID=A0AAV6X2K5_9LAMI|nr:hypothetical protein BUALT_Bualt09G0092500 [Buddleja alternifolia]
MSATSLATSMANKLQGKVALITGGASGIDEATSKLFTRYGAKVIIADIQDDRGQALCKELASSSATISYVHCDVTKEPDVKNAIDFAISEHGKLDIMFNNAGITPPMLHTSIFDTDRSQFEKVFDVNVFGAFLGAKHAARVMVPAKSGSIIFTASAVAVIGLETPPAYTCSKYVVVGLTNHLCMELGKDGIRANCISPFLVQTPMVHGALRSAANKNQAAEWQAAAANLKEVILKPDDIAEVAVFLGSDESKYHGIRGKCISPFMVQSSNPYGGHHDRVRGGFRVALEADDVVEEEPYIESDESKYVSGLILVDDGVTTRLQGKVALITGGASGIGEATAKLFTKYGAKVIIADVQDNRGQALCKELGSSSATISYAHCDVTKEFDVKNAVDFAVSQHGKLDIMFNNAGIVPSLLYSSIFDSEKSHFEKVFDVNVFGAFLGAKHAARAMVPAKSGSIIFTASAVAVIGVETPPAYNCSKHAVVGLTNHLCLELGKDGIRVNCISPFMVQTPMLDRMIGSAVDKKQAAEWLSTAANLKGVTLEADDIAEAAAFLGSDESKYVSGLNLVVDGGYSKVNPLVTTVMKGSHT